MQRFFVIWFVLITTSHLSVSQSKLSSKNYQFIDEDSIALFFNHRYYFTEKQCFEYVRLVKLNSQGQFEGYFEDISIDDRLHGKGNYHNSLKEGYFEIYYVNGGLKVKGYYHNDLPTGTWEYFYENGDKERTLRFTSTETLLIQYIDSAGNVLVKEGNGRFKGLVNALIGGDEDHSVIAEGDVIDGRPHGKWVGIFMEDPFCEEEFEHGKFVWGTSSSRGRKNQHTMHLDNFRRKDYFDRMDNFYTQDCKDSVLYISKPSLPNEQAKESTSLNSPIFESSLKKGIDRVIENDIRTENTQEYTIGDHLFTVKIEVDKEGEAKDIILLGAWGNQFIREISSSIRNHVTFSKRSNTFYLHFKFSVSGGAFINYKYGFSTNMSNSL